MDDIRIPDEDTEETPLPVGGSSSGGITLNKIWANVKTPLLVLALCWAGVAPFVAGSGGNDDNDSSRLQAIDSTTQRIAADVQTGNAVANATNKVVNRIDTMTTNTWNRVDCALKCPPAERTTSGGTRRRKQTPVIPRDSIPEAPRDTTPLAPVRRDTIYIQLPCPDTVVQTPKEKKVRVECKYRLQDGSTPLVVIRNGKVVYDGR